MAKKKKDEPERTCDNCAYGPVSEECEDCEHLDQWTPKEPDHQVHGERLLEGLDAIEKRHNELPDDCKISVNGGPAVPFPSPEATEQVTEMVKEHLEGQGVIPKVIYRRFIGEHILEEYEDGMVSFDGGPRVTKAAMKEVVDLVQIIKGEKAPKQLNLEGKPLPDPLVLEDESTEVKTYALYFSNGLKFRMGDESLLKALDTKKDESVANRNDRIRLLVQNRAKVMSKTKPLDREKWDAGTRAIYERIMVGHGREP